MELRHLRYFVAVGEALSFTKAAAKLRLAQPSLTRQVRNLEKELGVELLSRANNRVALTACGRQFLYNAKKVLALCAESVTAVQQMPASGTAEFNIGYSANLHSSLLSGAVAAFRKISPETTLNLFDMNRAEQLRALHERRIDVGFVGLDPAFCGEDLPAATVGRDHMMAALPAGHALARRAKLTLAALAAEPFIEMSPKTNPGAREWLLKTCASAGVTGQILQEAEEEATSLKFTADGLGVALVAEQVAGLPHPGVVFRALSPPLYRDAKMAWQAGNDSAALKDFIQILQDLWPRR